MLTLLAVAGLISMVLGAGIYTQKPAFGSSPSGTRLEKIENSPNYANGEFQNLIYALQRVDDGTSETKNHPLNGWR
ncbi:MAG: hypothetical protein VB133_06495 [Anaeromusa sp.]|uniref:hypothetical protein n=1 Tax=Anaeromusa sp. TaxID=1872520 RepID=UPI002B20C3CA|nr:hypothetical protein [Anaeromusa sp.]MEA4834764.1 hypothetical protein [Anaeromusa sp.]